MLLFASAANGLNNLSVEVVLITTIYAVLGAAILMAAYKIFDIINPLDFDEELKKNNMALGIMIAGFFLGMAVIIASAIMG